MSILYDAELGKQICIQLAMGYSLENLNEGEDGEVFPPLRQIMAWLMEEADFFTLYEKARRIHSDLITDRVASIVRKAQQLLEQDKTLTPSQRLSYSRMVIGSSKWLVNRLNPKKSTPRSQNSSKTQQKRMDKMHGFVQGHAGVQKYPGVQEQEYSGFVEPTHHHHPTSQDDHGYSILDRRHPHNQYKNL